MATQQNCALPSGFQLDHYRVERQLSLGGFSIVYLAYDQDGTPVWWMPTQTNTLGGQILAREALRDKDRIKKRERDFQVPTRIGFDNAGSDIYTIIEVETRDRPGLLYDLTRTLTANGISISSAIIATYGEQAVDVFYVKDLFGLKLYAEAKRSQLEQRLRAAIGDAAPAPDGDRR